MLLIRMAVWEPDGWNFSATKTKLTVLDSDQESDSTESSDDEQLFANSKILRKQRYKKITKEELLPE
jgi:hypothetical protein